MPISGRLRRRYWNASDGEGARGREKSLQPLVASIESSLRIYRTNISSLDLLYCRQCVNNCAKRLPFIRPFLEPNLNHLWPSLSLSLCFILCLSHAHALCLYRKRIQYRCGRVAQNERRHDDAPWRLFSTAVRISNFFIHFSVHSDNYIHWILLERENKSFWVDKTSWLPFFQEIRIKSEKNFLLRGREKQLTNAKFHDTCNKCVSLFIRGNLYFHLWPLNGTQALGCNAVTNRISDH